MRRDGYGIRYAVFRRLGVPWWKALYAALPTRFHLLVAVVRDEPIAYRLHIHGLLLWDSRAFPEPGVIGGCAVHMPHPSTYMDPPTGEKGLLN